MILKIKTLSGIIPEYKTPGAAGMDVSAWLDKSIILHPGERALIPTGIFMEIPPGYEIQIRARSGLALKYGIGLVNGVGTIDSDYRGELKIPLINWGSEDFVINSGDRIAQMIVSAYEHAEVVISSEFSTTQRGSGGFGHTGV